jgi:hypothetical protein
VCAVLALPWSCRSVLLRWRDPLRLQHAQQCRASVGAAVSLPTAPVAYLPARPPARLPACPPACLPAHLLCPARRSICPDEWIEKWQELRDSGSW